MLRKNHVTLCGATALALAATTHAELITNGNFSANASSFGTFPGYVGSAGNPSSITGWSNVGNTTYLGVNGPDVNFSSGSKTVFGPTSSSIVAGGSGTVNDFMFLQHNATGNDTNAGFNYTVAQQPITTTAGVQHTLTFDMSTRDGQGQGYLRLILTDKNGTNTIVDTQNGGAANDYRPLSTGWTRVNYTFTPVFGGTGVLLFGNDMAYVSQVTDNTVNVSNVSLTAVPEPTALAALGALGAALIRRRR